MMKKETKEYYGTAIATIVNKTSYFDCFNECIYNKQCEGVTAKGPGLITCVLKSSLSTNSITLTTNWEFRRIESNSRFGKLIKPINKYVFENKYV